MFVEQQNMESSQFCIFHQLNKSNRTHTSQDTCLISEKQLSCSHEWGRLTSRTEFTEDLGTNLENTHVFFPVQTNSIKPLLADPAVMTKLCEGGWGQDNGTHDVHTKCTASSFVFLALSQFCPSSSFCLSLSPLPLNDQFTQITLKTYFHTYFQQQKFQISQILCDIFLHHNKHGHLF